MMHTRIAFLGAGRMASAIIGGLLQRGVYAPGEIACTSAADGTGEAAASRFGIRHERDLRQLLEQAEIVVLAFKPQQLAELDAATARLMTGKLVLSILAGTTLARLGATIPAARNIVRSMPNTPGQIGKGITAYTPALPLSETDARQVEAILGALGEVIALDESQLDAVTGVSGSGPAYLFEFVAALRDGGIAAGLAPEIAYRLALQTVRGASELLAAVPETPEQHRDWVSSPGGTTLAGLKVMSDGGFRELLRETVLAATRRSRELASN